MAISYNLQSFDKTQVVKAFFDGKIIILPTETVYGLCCLATSDEAVNKIYKIKQRDFIKPLSVLVSSIEQINNFAILNNQAFNDLSKGNTVILQTKLNNFSKAIFGNTNGDSIGVRIPQNDIILDILRQINQPVVATSVNLSGEDPLTKIENLNKLIESQVDIIVYDDKICSGKPSSVIDYYLNDAAVIRK